MDTSISGRLPLNLLIAIAAATSNILNCAKVIKGSFFTFADMYDKDKTGTIDINEFQELFNCINKWKAVFESYDKDRSGRIEQGELEQGEWLLRHSIVLLS